MAINRAGTNTITYLLGKIKTLIPTKTSQLTNDSNFLTAHQDVSGKEDKSNKVTAILSTATDEQYPSAKAVYGETAKALKLTGGTMTGNLVAANPAVETQAVRNIYAGTTDLTPGVSALPTGVIYLVYE